MDESKNNAIHIIRKYLVGLEKYEPCLLTSAEFAQISYSRTAAIELLNNIRSDKSRSATTIIEEYMVKMNHYAYTNDFGSRIFSIKSDVAAYILEEIIVYKERRKSK